MCHRKKDIPPKKSLTRHRNPSDTENPCKVFHLQSDRKEKKKKKRETEADKLVCFRSFSQYAAFLQFYSITQIALFPLYQLGDFEWKPLQKVHPMIQCKWENSDYFQLSTISFICSIISEFVFTFIGRIRINWKNLGFAPCKMSQCESTHYSIQSNIPVYSSIEYR